MNVVILAAGQGKRMRSDLPKVLHPIAGKPMLGHVLDTARTLGATKTCVVYGHGGEQVLAGGIEAYAEGQVEAQVLAVHARQAPAVEPDLAEAVEPLADQAPAHVLARAGLGREHDTAAVSAGSPGAQ